MSYEEFLGLAAMVEKEYPWEKKHDRFVSVAGCIAVLLLNASESSSGEVFPTGTPSGKI